RLSDRDRCDVQGIERAALVAFFGDVETRAQLVAEPRAALRAQPAHERGRSCEAAAEPHEGQVHELFGSCENSRRREWVVTRMGGAPRGGELAEQRRDSRSLRGIE